MKHPTSRLLFAYWDRLRGERAAPERGDVKPGEMRHILPDSLVLAAERGGADALFRLAGTRCCALFGRELKGEPFAALWCPPGRADTELHVDSVLIDTVGLVVGAIGTSDEGAELPIEIVLLPLRRRGRGEMRGIGALTPRAVPDWAGIVPVRSLQTTSLRVIQPVARGLPRALQPSAEERRRMFVVHEGGRRTVAATTIV